MGNEAKLRKKNLII